MKHVINNWLIVAILIGVTGCTVGDVVRDYNKSRCDHILEDANFKATLDLIEKRQELNNQLIKTILEERNGQ